MDGVPENWAQRLLQQAKERPGRATFAVALLVLMAFMWGRYLMSSGSQGMPAAAQAAALPVSTPKPATPPGVVALRQWLQAPITLSRRNMFAVRLDYFPPDSTQAAAAPADGLWDQLAKSKAARADEKDARRILVANLQAEASKLKLQSTMMVSGAPRALVNGSWLAEGDNVNGFRVLRIEARRIVVEREGVKLEVLFTFNR